MPNGNGTIIVPDSVQPFVTIEKITANGQVGLRVTPGPGVSRAELLVNLLSCVSSWCAAQPDLFEADRRRVQPVGLGVPGLV